MHKGPHTPTLVALEWLGRDGAGERDEAGMTTTDPDFRPVFARGGTLLLRHGWSDGTIPARSTGDC